MRDSASELSAQDGGAEPLAPVPSKARSVLLGAATLAIAFGIVGGGVKWSRTRARPPSPEELAPAAHPPSAETAVAPSGPAPVPAHDAPGAPAPRDPTPPAATAPPPTKKARRVSVTISSEPPGAELCLASDGLVIGKTTAQLEYPADGRKLTFMVDHHGYRAARLAIKADRDRTETVSLRRLGPDDLESPPVCHR